MKLKWLWLDWAFAHRDELPKYARQIPWLAHPFPIHQYPLVRKLHHRRGPAGMTAALDLVRFGHKATVFDSLPIAGGMMRVGIPPHRLAL